MMAPYAIAHMKVGLKLTETGYLFATEVPVRIYLTNTLEPKVKQLPQIGFDALAHEAAAVNEIKWYKRFTVVIGNPQYSVSSQNNNPWIDKLSAAIKERVRGERNIQPLNDDCVKFLTLAQHLRAVTGCGLLGMITNRSFTNGKIHPGLRELLLKVFPSFSVVDLGGDTRSGETQLDENVFDITQGVAISLWSSLGRICKLPKKALPNIFVSVRKVCHVTRIQIQIVDSTASGNSKFHSHLTLIVTGEGENERPSRAAGRHWVWS